VKYSKVKAYKYKLEEDYTQKTDITGYEFNTRYYSMFENGILTVKYGYAWDGSSVPFKRLFRILSFGLYHPDKYCKIASLVHDALCQAMREGLLPVEDKQRADLIYQSLCILGGMGARQANRRYRALREFGDIGIIPEKHPRNKIYDTDIKKRPTAIKQQGDE